MFTNAKSILLHRCVNTSTQPRCYFLVLLAWYGACWRTLGLGVSILFAHVHCIDIRELRYTLMYEKLWHLQHATLPLGSSMYYIGLCGTNSEPPPPPPTAYALFCVTEMEKAYGLLTPPPPCVHKKWTTPLPVASPEKMRSTCLIRSSLLKI